MTNLLNNDQLNADLLVWRGGNKARLVARCWVAWVATTPDEDTQGLTADDYEGFRKAWTKKSFEAIHKAYDHILPQQFRASYTQGTGTGTARQTKKTNGMTEAQQKQFERFCKSPARLAKQFTKTADYYLSCIDGATEVGEQHLRAVAAKRQNAAAYCEGLIGNTQAMVDFWNDGLRTGGDLEAKVSSKFGF